MNPKHFTLITGASSGIGRAMAQECARRQQNVLLIALPGIELEETAALLRQEFAVEVAYFGVDLTEDGADRLIYEFCQSQDISIDILINNAGFGSNGAFDRHAPDFYEKMIKLNVMSTVLLTRRFLPELRQKQKAFILNTGSAAAFFDMPYKLVYAATKSFVYSFSRTLRQELTGSNVSVSVVCPGGVNTNVDVKKRTAQMGRMIQRMNLDPEEVAKAALDGLFKRKALILPGAAAKLYYGLNQILPYGLKLNLLHRIYQRTQ